MNFHGNELIDSENRWILTAKQVKSLEAFFLY